MAKNVVTAAERGFAISFLKYLGAPWQDNDKIYAVVAWLRQESGGLKSVIGNNPFNIRPGMTSKFATGTRPQYKNGKIVGYFLVFKNLDIAAKATAYLLSHAKASYGYGLIVEAFKKGSAIDALAAIALSAWNPAHYGYVHGDIRTNHLYQVYIGFTGMQIPKPQPKAKPKKKAIPPRPREYQNDSIAMGEFVDGYAARQFYEARRAPEMGNLGDLFPNRPGQL